ncbi:MAG: ABC transporter permease [Actinobacteria bacterium]|nr:ABC transporter permease [Actinomycetota bacterium]
MTAAAVIAALAALLLLPLVVAAVRQRTLLAMAVRNIGRRRAEAALVVAGALLGTAIITSSFVVGDIVEGSLADAARTQYGPVDITLTPTEGADLAAVTAAVEAADVDGVDGLLPAITATATLEAPRRDAAVPQVRVTELDIPAARAFGADPDITGLEDSDRLAPGEVLLNERTAGQVDARVGDTVRMHAYGATVDLVVSEVVAEIGLAGYGGAIVAPGTVAGLAESATAPTARPQHHLFVSLDGGVFDTRALSDGVAERLRAAVAGLPDVEVQTPKAGLLDDAARDGAGLTEIFSTIGVFSVLAGILLLVNLFVMLAEERKTEFGMLRAVGFTRRRLTRAFAIEGALYAIVAAALGAVVGVGIGWLVAMVAGPIFGAADGAGYPLVIEPASLALGAGIGLVISLVTIWATSLRIARLNIIRAIRDLPEPRIVRVRARTLLFASAGVLIGAGAGIAGYRADNAIGFLLGVPVAAFSAAPLLRRLLPERTARLLVASTVLAWGLAVRQVFPEIMGAADMVAFVVQGVVLTVGAVSLAASLDRVWTFAVERLGRGGRGLAPRLGIAYPLARRFRTAMLLGMFSLVILTVTMVSAFSAAIEANSDAQVRHIAAGFDLLLDVNPANPVAVETLAARSDVTAVAGLVRGVASFEAAHLDGPRSWPVSGFGPDLLDRGTPGLFSRDEAYASDADAYQAVLDDPTLAIVPEDFLVAGVGDAALAAGDRFTVVEPGSGRRRELTIAGLGEADWLGNGALVNREVTAALFGPDDIVTRSYVAVHADADPADVAASLNAAFLPHGADAHTFTALGAEGVRVMTGFIALLRGFLGFGLLVGIAGLGVVMVRAVRERRQEIGMLRAMGFRKELVRTAMLSEAGLIALQGTVIGAVLGLVTTQQILTGSDSFGDTGMPFIVPWAGLALVVVLPLLAALLATAWPAARAAAIRPAVALRTSD